MFRQIAPNIPHTNIRKCCVSYINYKCVTDTILRVNVDTRVLQYQIYHIKQTGTYFGPICKQGIVLLWYSKCFVENKYASVLQLSDGIMFVLVCFQLKVVTLMEVIYTDWRGTGHKKISIVTITTGPIHINEVLIILYPFLTQCDDLGNFCKHGLTSNAAWMTITYPTQCGTKWFINSQSMVYIVERWSLGMYKLFHPTLHKRCNFLSLLGLNLIPVNEQGSCIATCSHLWFFFRFAATHTFCW